MRFSDRAPGPLPGRTRPAAARESPVSLPRVAAAHAEALDVQIRTLRLRRLLLTSAAKRGSTPEELELTHKLATLSEDERRRMIGDFLDTVFDGPGTHPAFTAVIHSITPELPDEPTVLQIRAWVEPAELFQDSGFRSTVQGMAKNPAADRAPDDTTGLPRILAEALRGNHVGPKDQRDTTTPRALAATYRDLVRGDALSGDKRTLLKDWLLRNATHVGATRIRAGLPKGWTMGDKTRTGNWGKANDITIVWPPRTAPTCRLGTRRTRFHRRPVRLRRHRRSCAR